MRRLTRKPIRLLAGVIAALGLAFLVYESAPQQAERSRATDAFRRASQVRNGSKEAEAAVRELASLEGERVTELLLMIALGDVEFSNERIAAEAVRALGARHDVEVSNDLASLLRPEKSIVTRLAVANALHALGCPMRCTQRVLSYLSRIHSGELNIEDETIAVYERSGMSNEAVERAAGPIRRSQEVLYSSLEELLASAPSRTIEVLEQDYGLSSRPPSPFAARLVGRLRISLACAPLVAAAEAIAADQHSPIAETIQESIVQIGCEGRR